MGKAIPNKPSHLRCVDCSVEFEWRKPGKKPLRCIECNRVYTNERERVRQSNVRAGRYPLVVTCHREGCHNLVVRTSAKDRRFVCQICRHERVSGYAKKYKISGARRKTIVEARLRQYGLTPEQYDAMLTMQGGSCALCDRTEPGGAHNNWHIDHDHTCCAGPRSCGQCVRGLLCNNCNVGLGNFGDDPARLRAALDYLERPRLRLAG